MSKFVILCILLQLTRCCVHLLQICSSFFRYGSSVVKIRNWLLHDVFFLVSVLAFKWNSPHLGVNHGNSKLVKKRSFSIPLTETWTRFSLVLIISCQFVLIWCISMRKTAEHIRASQSLQISLKRKLQSKVQQSRFYFLVFVFVSQEWNFTRLTMQFKLSWVGIILRCKKRSNPFIVSSCETGTICDFFESWKLKEVWNSLAYLVYLHQNVL